MATQKLALIVVGKMETVSRYVMGVMALFALLASFAFNAGYIRTTPEYDLLSWYQVAEHSGYHIVKRFDTEAACHNAQPSDKAKGNCQNGRQMMGLKYINQVGRATADTMTASVAITSKDYTDDHPITFQPVSSGTVSSAP